METTGDTIEPLVRAILAAGVSLALVTAAGCGETGGEGGEVDEDCVPGRVLTCGCPGGGQGIQTCGQDGQYGRCECANDSGASVTPDTGPAPDTGETVDAGRMADTGSAPDTAEPDTGVTMDTGADTGTRDTSSPPERTVTLPVEVIGPDGTTEQIEVGVEKPGQVENLYLRAYSIGYPYHYVDKRGYQTDKASVRLNGGSWVDIDNDNVTCEEPEASARCVNGPMHTIDFTIPVSKLGSLQSGANTVEFRFNYANPQGEFGDPSTGYRILGVEFRDGSGNDHVSRTDFRWDDPGSWQAPKGFRNDQAVQAGKTLWNKRDHMVDSWDGQHQIKAACADCHVDSGYDLEYFAYSNHSIIQRSKFHGLSDKEGKQIAAYIRSIELKTEDGKSYAPPGRPWNPPYQPGPTAAASRNDGEPRDTGKSFDELPAAFWAAGAGEEWALDHDDETRDYLFPNGINYGGEVSVSGSLNVRQLPVAVQMLDWNAWLPVHHPMDVWGAKFTDSDVWKAYKNEIPDAIASGDPTKVERAAKSFKAAFRNMSGMEPFRPESAPSEFDLGIASASRAQWALVKSFELLHVHHYEDDARDVYGKEAAPLQWLSGARTVFNQAPHITGEGNPRGPKSGIMDRYHDTAWYQLQMVMNSGQGFSVGIAPHDWKYHFGHITGIEGVGGSHSWRYVSSYMRLIQNAEHLGDNHFSAQHHPEGWYLRHTTPTWMSKGRAQGKHLDALDDATYRKVLDVVMKMWLDGVTEEPLSEWSRNDSQYGLEPSSWTPKVINRFQPRNSTDYADHIYTAAQQFDRYGLDKKLLRRLTDWGDKLWPNASDPSWDEIASN